MPAYNAAVAAYFSQPARVAGGTIAGAAGSLAQGTWVCVSADVRDGILCNPGFRVFGCPHIIAACNWVMEFLTGKPAEQLRDVPLAELRAKFDIPVEKAGKLLILQDALQACFAEFETYSELQKVSQQASREA